MLKNRVVFGAVLSILLLSSCNHYTLGDHQFRITGGINGLVAGDTLRFSRVILPKWELEPAFDVVLSEDSVFQFIGSQEHTQLYLMQYYPLDKKVPYSDRSGLTLLIPNKSSTHLAGVRDYIYYCTPAGGVYDSALQHILAMEDSLGKLRGDLSKEINQAFERKEDSLAQAKIALFNNFSYHHKEDFNKIKEAEVDYFEANGGEYAASCLAQSTYKPLSQLKESFAALTAEGQQSYYGQFCRDIIQKMEAVEPGHQASDLTLTTLDGRTIQISDFRGKYLLIFHFGLCPGALQLDPLVTKLYQGNKDRLEVLGLTSSMAELKKIASQEPLFKEMTQHPWPNECDLSKHGNDIISSEFNIIGLPFCILIAPDGEILERSIGNEAYLETVKRLKGETD